MLTHGVNRLAGAGPPQAEQGGCAHHVALHCAGAAAGVALQVVGHRGACALRLVAAAHAGGAGALQGRCAEVPDNQSQEPGGGGREQRWCTASAMAVHWAPALLFVWEHCAPAAPLPVRQVTTRWQSCRRQQVSRASGPGPERRSATARRAHRGEGRRGASRWVLRRKPGSAAGCRGPGEAQAGGQEEHPSQARSLTRCRRFSFGLHGRLRPRVEPSTRLLRRTAWPETAAVAKSV